MKWITLLAAMTIGIGSFAIVGCEEEVAYEKKVDVDDNTVKTKETKVTKEADGDIRIDETKKVDQH
jgi:hypothetical protein